jgi:hypothetical protein
MDVNGDDDFSMNFLELLKGRKFMLLKCSINHHLWSLNLSQIKLQILQIEVNDNFQKKMAIKII